MDDIALPVPNKQTREQVLLQEELEKYKRDVLEGLQVEEEGMTDYLRRKTKHITDQKLATSANDPSDVSVTESASNLSIKRNQKLDRKKRDQ